MGKDFLNGKINQNTKATGKIIKLPVKEFSFGKMEASMTVNGQIQQCMGMVSILGKMAGNLKEILNITKDQAEVSKPGQTDEYMMVNGQKVSNTEWEN